MMELYTAARTLTDQKLQAFQNDILDVRNKSKLLDLRYDTFLQKQCDIANKHGGTNVLPSDIIKLNVGGTRMRVLRETLTLIKGSRLEVMFSGRWENKLQRDDDEGCVFMDVDPRYFEKILEYLYSIEQHQKEGVTKNKNLPELPKFGNDYEQKVFDLYINFFRLEQKKSKGYKLLSSTNKKVSNVKEGGNMTYEDLINAFKEEEEELKKVEKRLDEMDEALEGEEDFVSYFFTTNESSNKGQLRNCDSDDDISFVSMSSSSSDLGSTVRLNESAFQNPSIMKDNDILNLWVSGKVIPVRRSTICQFEDSRLAQDFNNAEWLKEHSIQCEDGKTLIRVDHPSSVFSLIINQLRLMAIMTAREGVEDQMPLITINNIKDLIHLKNIVSQLFEGQEDLFISGSWANADSKIIQSKTDQNHLRTWLVEVNKTSEPRLLYSASRDGWKSSDFHSRCDDEGATLTIVKTKKGYVFGGYSNHPWTKNSSGYKSSNEAFMFSLKCHEDLLPTKMKLKHGMSCHAAYCHPKCGPIFGGGNDLWVGKGMDLKSGYTYLNNTYEMPPDATSRTYLTGKHGAGNPFEVVELEVFKV